MVLWVVDAHTSYQAGLNVESLAREGYSALIVKATQSLTAYTAPAAFDNWVTRALDSGMVPGAYHWLSNLDPIGQADHYTKRIERHLSRGLIPAYDNEDVSSPCSIDTLARFVERMHYNIGPRPALHYSGAWWARTRIGNYPLAGLGLVPWDSRYVKGSGYASVLYQGVPAGWWVPGYGGFARSKMLQFSSHGTAGGITANVDVNAFDGTREELLALAAGTGTGGIAVPMSEGISTMSSAELDVVGALGAGVVTDGYVTSTFPARLRDNLAGNNIANVRAELAQAKTELIAAVGTAGGGTLTADQFGQLLDRVDQALVDGTDRLIAETRVAIASVVEQALQPLRQGLGGFGAHLVEAAQDLDKIDDPPAAPAAG